MIMLLGVTSFAVAAFLLSWAVGKRSKNADAGELSASVLMVAWGAMLFGMYIARL